MSTLNHFFSVNIRPRKTIHFIIGMSVFYRFWFPFVLYAIGGLFLPIMLSLGAPELMTIGILRGLASAGCAAIYAVSICFWGALLSWTGRWLGGQARSKEFRALLSWAMAPTIIVLYASSLMGIFGLLLPIAGIWAFVIQIGMIAEIQKFSIARALSNFFLPIFCFLIFVASCFFIAAFFVKNDTPKAFFRGMKQGIIEGIQA